MPSATAILMLVNSLIVVMIKIIYRCFREKIADLEKSLEKCEAEKYTLECRIEQRHLQVGGCIGYSREL